MDLPQPSQRALESLVAVVSGAPAELIEEMPGGASARRYFRVPRAGRPWAVAMYVPDAAQTDEISKAEGSFDRWPFVVVHELLERGGVAVPKILGEACEEGILLLEDLGDNTLANYLTYHRDQREALYEQAVVDVARAQLVLAGPLAQTIVAHRRFDVDLLRWEVEHFKQWALLARGFEIDEADREVFDAAAEYLAGTISMLPYGFVHRDYQSRNLMVRQTQDARVELVWIDFQDALLGPRVYDLVALLGDSYQSFSQGFVQERLDQYGRELALSRAERAALGVEFLTVMVQRKLKDAGRFVFLDQVKGKPEFLQFVESTIDRALSALSALTQVTDVPQLTALDEMLRRTLSRA